VGLGVGGGGGGGGERGEEGGEIRGRLYIIIYAVAFNFKARAFDPTRSRPKLRAFSVLLLIMRSRP